MRIIAGQRRGMNLFRPKGLVSRPITDRAKESLFNVLQKYTPMGSCHVADLFCGVGSLGLEALSRGAKEAVFVDTDRAVLEILKKNIAKAGFGAQTRVVCANAFKIGAPKSLGGQKYSLVFVDPPYEMSKDSSEESRLAGLLRLLAEQLTDDGLVTVRTEKRVALLDSYGSLRITDRRIWSSTAVTFLALKKDDKQTRCDIGSQATEKAGV
jgi:16S rRNA (guanine(966)-N(2))-methyltransferase RsmD